MREAVLLHIDTVGAVVGGNTSKQYFHCNIIDQKFQKIRYLVLNVAFMLHS